MLVNRIKIKELLMIKKTITIIIKNINFLEMRQS